MFAANQKEKAKWIKENVTDENFVSLMALQIDVLSIVTAQSLAYQKVGGTIVGDYSRQITFSKNLEQLKSGQSDNFAKFLKETKCARTAKQLKNYLDSGCKRAVPSCNTIEKYDKCKFKSYKCIKLSKPKKSKFKPLSSYLTTTYIPKLISEHQKFFLEDGMLKHFEVLNFKKWTDHLTSSQERDSIKVIGQSLNIDNYDSLGILWSSFKDKLMKSSFWCTHKDDNLNIFWSALLQDKSISISPPLKKLIENTLVLGVSNSHVERLFSILVHIRRKERESCLVSTVDDLIRIRVNGPR